MGIQTNSGVVAVHLRQAGDRYNHAIVDIAGVAISTDGDQSEFSALIALDSAAEIQYGALRGLNLSFEDLDNAEDRHKVVDDFEAWVKSYAKAGDPICVCNPGIANALASAKVKVGYIVPWNYVCNALDWADAREVAPVVPIMPEPAVVTARLLAQAMSREFLGVQGE